MQGIFRIIAAAALVAACTNASLETTYTKQASNIESFASKQVASDSTVTVHYTSKATRVTIAEGEGDEVGGNGLVSINYAGYDFSSGSINASKMFATNVEEVATGAGWSLADSTVFTPLVINLGSDNLYPGLISGLKGVKAGEECYILFIGKYASPKSTIGTIPANAPLAFHVWVNDIEN